MNLVNTRRKTIRESYFNPDVVGAKIQFGRVDSKKYIGTITRVTEKYIYVSYDRDKNILIRINEANKHNGFEIDIL